MKGITRATPPPISSNPYFSHLRSPCAPQVLQKTFLAASMLPDTLDDDVIDYMRERKLERKSA